MLSSLPTTGQSPRRPDLGLWQKLLRLDWGFFLLMLALCCASIAVVYSATYASDSDEFRHAYKAQALWLGLGLIGFFVMALTDYHFWVKNALFIFGAALALLVLVLLVGSKVNGAVSWIRLGGIGVQPAELSKITFILLLGWIFTHYSGRGIKMFAGVVVMTLVPMALILKQPDLGSASVYLPIAFVMMFIAGVKKKILLLPIFAALALMVYITVLVQALGPNETLNLFGHKLKQYQTDRILTFFNPNRDAQGAGWTINQSLIAIGSGGVSGKGYLQGTTIVLGFLPRNIAYNDFIFPVVCEQFGFIGGSLLIVALGGMLLWILRIAFSTADALGTLLAAGIVGMLFTHIFINIGMTIKVVPITGIPLPFISYGGTFLVVCLAALGLVQSVWIHRRN